RIGSHGNKFRSLGEIHPRLVLVVAEDGRADDEDRSWPASAVEIPLIAAGSRPRKEGWVVGNGQRGADACTNSIGKPPIMSLARGRTGGPPEDTGGDARPRWDAPR